MKVTYKGTEERVFPSLGTTVKPGDVIDAPEGFSHPDFTVGGEAKPSFTTAPKIETTTTQSAASDTIAKEVK
jgi:hypothetical protein